MNACGPEDLLGVLFPEAMENYASVLGLGHEEMPVRVARFMLGAGASRRPPFAEATRRAALPREGVEKIAEWARGHATHGTTHVTVRAAFMLGTLH